MFRAFRRWIEAIGANAGRSVPVEAGVKPPAPTRAASYRLIEFDVAQLIGECRADARNGSRLQSHLHSRSHLRSKLQVMRALVAIALQNRFSEDEQIEQLRQKAAQFESVRRKAVDQLLSSNPSMEELIRSLAWALAAPQPWDWRCLALPARRFLETLSDESLTDPIERGNTPALLVWWLESGPPNKSVLDWVRSRNGILLMDLAHWGGDAPTDLVVLDANPAWVTRPSACGDEHRVRLSGAAARVQATLAGPLQEQWQYVIPPAGFTRLEHRILPTDLTELAEHRCIAALDADGTGQRIVVHHRLLPKTGSSIRYSIQEF